MKVIALLPVLNEDWILPTYIKQMKRFTSQILVIDSGSSDRTKQILTAEKITFRSIRRDKFQKNGSIIRNELINWGRQARGTHFIWLDADEIFSTHFLEHYQNYLKQMKPGQKLWMDWVPMWKDPFSMLSDSSQLWTKLKKDMIYCDDGKTNFDAELIHEGRTPGQNDKHSTIPIPRNHGVALHYQFVNWHRFQAKQCWYRCLELITKKMNVDEINEMYAFTLKGQRSRTELVPTSWIDDVVTPNQFPYRSYIDETLGLFDQFGITTFEALDIWHVEELKDAFLKTTGRLPQPVLLPYRIARKLKQVKKSIHKVYYDATH